jgi:nicotinamidase-related amidase
MPGIAVRRMSIPAGVAPWSMIRGPGRCWRPFFLPCSQQYDSHRCGCTTSSEVATITLTFRASAGAKQLTGPEPAPAQVTADPCYLQLRALREKEIFPGVHNQPDIRAGFQRLDFAPEARPVGNEGIAETGSQLAALCRADDINHLVYIGFAINWCLLMSPGGMVDLGRHGLICSVLEDAVTAVENRETAREQREKAQALWRVSLEWGFVFNSVDFMRALTPTVPATQPSSP